MKERPILFSAPMVRALLNGTKTQTRRIVKEQPITGLRKSDATDGGRPYWCDYTKPREMPPIHNAPGDAYTMGPLPVRVFCPYGVPGDRLWVRETWRVGRGYDDLAPCLIPSQDYVKRCYDADGATPEWAGKGRPTIHMPRWLSRISLEITDVRAQRLQEITEEDAIAEGIEPLFTADEKSQRPEVAHNKNWANYLWHGRHGEYGLGNAKSDAWAHQMSGYVDPRGSYSSLWESINGAGSWDANPWVWAITFRRVTP